MTLYSAAFHKWATIGWLVLGMPISYTLMNYPKLMALWIAGISVYSNMATHWGAYQGARAEKAAKSK